MRAHACTKFGTEPTQKMERQRLLGRAVHCCSRGRWLCHAPLSTDSEENPVCFFSIQGPRSSQPFSSLHSCWRTPSPSMRCRPFGQDPPPTWSFGVSGPQYLRCMRRCCRARMTCCTSQPQAEALQELLRSRQGLQPAATEGSSELPMTAQSCP